MSLKNSIVYVSNLRPDLHDFIHVYYEGDDIRVEVNAESDMTGPVSFSFTLNEQQTDIVKRSIGAITDRQRFDLEFDEAAMKTCVDKLSSRTLTQLRDELFKRRHRF